MNASLVRRWALVVAVGSALVLAWHGAIDAALIVPAPPDFVPHQAIDEAFVARFVWLRGIATHDLGVRILAAATFLALAGLGRALISRSDERSHGAEDTASMAPAGRLLVVAGLVGAIGQLIELGGHDAAIEASMSAAPVTSVMLNLFFFDQVGAAMAAATWAVFGTAALLGAFATRGWLAVPGVVLGAALLVIAASWWIDDPADLTSSLLTLAGLVLIPVWALSLDRAPVRRPGFAAPLGPRTAESDGSPDGLQA
jgi:hypothetical protein